MKSVQRIRILVWCILFINMPGFALVPEKLTPDVINELKTSVTFDAEMKALINAVTNNDVKELAFNRELFTKYNDIFNLKIDTHGITNQKSSGRCWLFAGLNIMRPAVMKKFNLSSFEFSENYLFFWDKLEKANMFLEAMIMTRDRDIDDRELQTLLSNPVPDGGWWNYVVGLIEKYGAVPKEIMPETKNSSNTRMMNAILNTMMRQDAVLIRKLARQGKKEAAIRAQKLQMLKDVYRLLIVHLGQPPEEFTWRCEDKDHKIIEETYTPLSFYEEAVGFDLRNYVSILDHPAHPYNKHYRINFCRNMPDITDMDFINLKIEKLKNFAFKALLDKEPVWFAADISKENDNKNGILAVGIYDYESLLNVNARLTKAERVLYRASTPNHAMVFVGVDTLNGRPQKWLVENSWGTDRGNKGLWTMYDDWFDEYVFAVIIHRKHLPENVLKLLKTKPETLPAWDPMRTAF